MKKLVLALTLFLAVPGAAQEFSPEAEVILTILFSTPSFALYAPEWARPWFKEIPGAPGECTQHFSATLMLICQNNPEDCAPDRFVRIPPWTYWRSYSRCVADAKEKAERLSRSPR